jgi:Protein of unknown function (DUF2628)
LKLIRNIRTFRVFKHAIFGYRAVKVGFSWPGLFFSGIWLLLKRLWGYAIAFFLISLLLSFLEAGFEKEENIAGMVLVLWLQLGIYIFVGVKGNEWHENNLKRRGFELIGSVQAETPSAAIGKIAGV